MLVLDLLKEIKFGNSVAEFDEALDKYFIETDIFRRVVSGDVDVIAGDKGTGKTALFRILGTRYTELPELDDIEVIPAFNPTGTPVFQRLTEGDPLTEPQYINLWKSYLLSLAGNWLLTLYEDEWTPAMIDLDELLRKTGLSSADDSPTTIFSSIISLFKRLMNPESIGVAFTLGPHGMPVVFPHAEFGGAEAEEPEYVPHEDAFALLDRALAESGTSVWLALDRLDEAFAGTPAAELPALRRFSGRTLTWLHTDIFD